MTYLVVLVFFPSSYISGWLFEVAANVFFILFSTFLDVVKPNFKATRASFSFQGMVASLKACMHEYTFLLSCFMRNSLPKPRCYWKNLTDSNSLRLFLCTLQLNEKRFHCQVRAAPSWLQHRWKLFKKCLEFLGVELAFSSVNLPERCSKIPVNQNQVCSRTSHQHLQLWISSGWLRSLSKNNKNNSFSFLLQLQY